MSVSKTRFGAALLAGTVLGGTTAIAQTAPDEAIQLDAIVVTASGFAQNVAEAPASISVITSEEIWKGSFTSLSDALREVQGVVTTGVADEQDIFIRGLPGQYTLILVDGKRQGTRESRTNGSSGYEQSFIPPAAAIDRIEIVRGPMSSLYGSDAMGGVINIITKKVADTWTGSLTLENTFQDDGDFENSRQQSFYLSGPLVGEKLGLQVWGRKFDQDASRVKGGPSASDDHDLTAKLSYLLNENHEFFLEAGKTAITTKPIEGTSYQRNEREHWSLSHVGRWGNATSELSFSQEIGERRQFSRVAVDELGKALDPRVLLDDFYENLRSPKVKNSIFDAKVTVPLSFAGEHTLTVGGQYFDARISDQNVGAQAGLPTAEKFDEKFSVNQWAIFAEDEWRLRDDLALTLGARINEHEVYGTEFTPRVYAVWNATDALTIKGGVSTGFRAPDLRTVAPGYVSTTGGGGCVADPASSRPCGVIPADENIKPESTTSIELGALYEGSNFSFGATAFQTKFNDKIMNARQQDANGNVVPWPQNPAYVLWYNYNDDATIRGLELAGDVTLTDTLTLRGSYTLTKSEQDTGDFKGFPLARTPEHSASLRLDWVTPVAGLDVWGSANYHGSEIASGARIGESGSPVIVNGVEGRKYSPYATVDIGGGYEINENASINAAVYNVFDEQITEAEFNTVQEGRRLWVGLTTTF